MFQSNNIIHKQQSRCYWITGLSASGKTTLGRLLVDHFRINGRVVIYLDGDELRQVLSDNAYTREERIALGMRYSRLCALLINQGIDVVITVIGLFKELHTWNRKNIQNYVEIFVDTPLDELIRRDPKNIYKKFLSGSIKNVSGLDLEVDFPLSPHVHLKWSDKKTVNSMFKEMLDKIDKIS